MSLNAAAPAPQYSRERPARRCCARCRTPYNCGNTGCHCHTIPRETALAAARNIAERHKELLDRLGAGA